MRVSDGSGAGPEENEIIVLAASSSAMPGCEMPACGVLLPGSA